MGHFWQYAIIALALLWSVAYLIQRQFPQWVRAARTWLALRLLSTQRPIARRMARALVPPASAPLACATSGGCGGCGKSTVA